MKVTKLQQKLDIRKWLKSEKTGVDACGSFGYCAFCNKALANPCDKAYKKRTAANRLAKQGK